MSSEELGELKVKLVRVKDVALLQIHSERLRGALEGEGRCEVLILGRSLVLFGRYILECCFDELKGVNKIVLSILGKDSAVCVLECNEKGLCIGLPTILSSTIF